MDRNVTGITYTTYIDPSQVNSDNCDLTNVVGLSTWSKNYGPSDIQNKGPLGDCRKDCETISGKFNLTIRK